MLVLPFTNTEQGPMILFSEILSFLKKHIQIAEIAVTKSWCSVDEIRTHFSDLKKA